jgi:hypothetical protein
MPITHINKELAVTACVAGQRIGETVCVGNLIFSVSGLAQLRALTRNLTILRKRLLAWLATAAVPFSGYKTGIIV